MPAAAATRIRERPGVCAPLGTDWRHDEWLVADGSMQVGGGRRVYIIHTWPPRFRCRVIPIVPDTGNLDPGEQPADMDNGLGHGVAQDTGLIEFDWIARPPAEATPALLDVAAGALWETQLE